MIDEALNKLGESTRDAVCGVLDTYAAGHIEPRGTNLAVTVKEALGTFEAPLVLATVGYVDGATGGNAFIMPTTAACRLSAVMMGGDPDTAGDEVGELELSAVGEAMNQMMAAAARTTSDVLEREVDITPPETHVVESLDDLFATLPDAPHVVVANVAICGELCRLVQLVPTAFTRRFAQALEDQAAEAGNAEIQLDAPELDLSDISVLLSAELGRTRMTSSELVGAPAGSVIELDRDADEPVGIYVNGRLFATARLLVVEGDEWAVQIESLLS